MRKANRIESLDCLKKLFTYNFDLFAELSLSDLACTLFVKVSIFDFVLELTEFWGLSADLLDFSGLLFLLNLHLSHLASQLLLH